MSATKWMAGIVVAGLLVAVAAGLRAVDTHGAHPTSADCGSCHMFDAMTDHSNAAKLLATQEQLCTRCHAKAVEFSHPTGFAPLRALPSEFPLDWKGDFTCSTCHLTHGVEKGLLRGSRRGKEFCLSCHEQSFFSRMKDAGASLVISGHLYVGRGQPALDIDRHSMHCLGCHASGAYAAGGTVSMGSNGVVQHGSGSAPHPIGFNYRETLGRADYNPEAELARHNIKLSEGKVSCISCHDVYKKDHGKLVMSMNRSALCLACHAK